MPNEAKLAEFVAWCTKHITGDEKGQAQIFLDRLFQACGHPGVLDVGGATEFRIRKGKEDGGGTAFADLVWKPIVLIEMKKRGTTLQKHYRQAFGYWTRLVPNRPRYVVLCNFDEFQVYDFETQMDSPVDSLTIAELPQRWGPLAFLFPDGGRPTFNNDRLAVTREAADCLAACFRELISRKRKPPIEPPLAQKFVLQMLIALFAEDIELLPKYIIARLLEDCHSPTDSYDLLGGLFDAMNKKTAAKGGRFKDIPYFNGGLFAEPARVELFDEELALLRKAAQSDWSRVQPEIFGTLFQHSMDEKERHKLGAHFTSPVDIMKIVGPTITEPWTEQIEKARTRESLYHLLTRLHDFRVLDPACGSGNFLYIAYRELKRIEARVFERMDTEFKMDAKQTGQIRVSYLSAKNFYGLDILPFAVEIAKVTMMIARKLAIDELHITEEALPLDNLDDNFIAIDALLTPEGTPVRWPKADVIIGNPPFLGAKLLKPERGVDYANTLRRAYPEIPGMADYCTYWIRKAHDLLPACTSSDPVTGRAGLVGTQNIRSNLSRVGGLDHVVKTGTVVEAVASQPWSGEANVNVSIVNWVKTQDATIVPEVRTLWFKSEPSSSKKKSGTRVRGAATKEYDLDYRESGFISSSLSDQTDVSGALRLECNFEPQVCFSGQVPGHEGFVLQPGEARAMLQSDSRNREVIFPFLIGRDLLSGDGSPSEWIIDFQTRTVIEASTYSEPFARIKSRVLPTRERKVEEGKTAGGEQRPHHKQFLKYWWRHSFDRPGMIDVLAGMPRFIVCSDTTKRPIFCFLDSRIRPDHKLRVFAFADDYSFGIMQSHAHWLWFITKCSNLTERPNYTSSSVFDTFAWPQAANRREIQAVADAAREVRRVRDNAKRQVKGGLRGLYRTLELPGSNPLRDAHAELDVAVLAAYGFSARKDLLAQLLRANRDVAEKINKGESVVAPGIPGSFADGKSLITDDCIRPQPKDTTKRGEQ